MRTDNPLEGSSEMGSRFKLSFEGVDDLLAAIYETQEIKRGDIELPRRDLMYQILQRPNSRSFPIHKVLSDSMV